MPDLVDVEGIRVEHRRRLQILPDRASVAAVRARVEEGPVEHAEADEEPAALGGGDEIALALSRLPVQTPAFGPLWTITRPRHSEGEGEAAGAEESPPVEGTRGHAPR